MPQHNKAQLMGAADHINSIQFSSVQIRSDQISQNLLLANTCVCVCVLIYTYYIYTWLYSLLHLSLSHRFQFWAGLTLIKCFSRKQLMKVFYFLFYFFHFYFSIQAFIFLWHWDAICIFAFAKIGSLNFAQRVSIHCVIHKLIKIFSESILKFLVSMPAHSSLNENSCECLYKFNFNLLIGHVLWVV